VPYLKGIHLTLDSWRPLQDREGWRTQAQLAYHLSIDDTDTQLTQPPAHVTLVPRLKDDLEGLQLLFNHPHPPKCLIRSKQIACILYGLETHREQVLVTL
jgi:hypothetical protein